MKWAGREQTTDGSTKRKNKGGRLQRDGEEGNYCMKATVTVMD